MRLRAAERPSVASFFVPTPHKRHMSFGLQILFQSYLSMKHKLSDCYHSYHILEQLTKPCTPGLNVGYHKAGF